MIAASFFSPPFSSLWSSFVFVFCVSVLLLLVGRSSLLLCSLSFYFIFFIWLFWYRAFRGEFVYTAHISNIPGWNCAYIYFETFRKTLHRVSVRKRVQEINSPTYTLNIRYEMRTNCTASERISDSEKWPNKNKQNHRWIYVLPFVSARKQQWHGPKS